MGYYDQWNNWIEEGDDPEVVARGGFAKDSGDNDGALKKGLIASGADTIGTAAAAISSKAKYNGAGTGATVGSVVDTAMNFIPGIGPILSQLHIGKAVGSLIGGKSDQAKYENDYNTQQKRMYQRLEPMANNNPYGAAGVMFAEDGGVIEDPKKKGPIVGGVAGALMGASTPKPVKSLIPKSAAPSGDIATYYPKPAIVPTTSNLDLSLSGKLNKILDYDPNRPKNPTFEPRERRGYAEQAAADEYKAEQERIKAQEGSDLAQTMGLFTPFGSNPGAGRIGAETFANMNPIGSGPILATQRLGSSALHPLNSPYYSPGMSTVEHVLGGLALLGDAGMVDLGAAGAVGKTAKAGYNNIYKVNPWAFKELPGKQYIPADATEVQGMNSSWTAPLSFYNKLIKRPDFLVEHKGISSFADVNYPLGADTRILKKDPIMGYKEAPSSFKDVRDFQLPKKTLLGTMGKSKFNTVDWNTNLAGGDNGSFNFGVFPLKSNPNILVKVSKNGSWEEMMGIDFKPNADDLIAKTADIGDQMVSRRLKNVPIKSKSQGLVSESWSKGDPKLRNAIQALDSEPNIDPRTGQVTDPLHLHFMTKVPGKSIAKMTSDELAGIEQQHVDKLVSLIDRLHTKGIGFEALGDNIRYNPETKRFGIIDLESLDKINRGTDPYTVRQMYHVFDIDQLNNLDMNRLASKIKAKFRWADMKAWQPPKSAFPEKAGSLVSPDKVVSASPIKPSAGAAPANSTGFDKFKLKLIARDVFNKAQDALAKDNNSLGPKSFVEPAKNFISTPPAMKQFASELDRLFGNFGGANKLPGLFKQKTVNPAKTGSTSHYGRIASMLDKSISKPFRFEDGGMVGQELEVSHEQLAALKAAGYQIEQL